MPGRGRARSWKSASRCGRASEVFGLFARTVFGNVSSRLRKKTIFRNLLPHSSLSQRERSKGKRPSFIQGAERTYLHEGTNILFPHPAKCHFQ